MAIDVNAETFDQEVIQSEVPVLVDFWGPQCGPCLALMPAVESMTEKYNPDLKFVKVDASKNRRLCLSLKVLRLPTYILYKDGQEVERLGGDELTVQDLEKSISKIV